MSGVEGDRVAIRPAVPADGRPIAEIHRTTWAATYTRWIPDVVAGYDVERSAAGWAAATAQTDRRVAVAVDGDRVVGFAASGPAEPDSLAPDDDPTRTGEVYAIYVDPAWHGRGVGARLIADALDWLAADGRAQCVLWVAEPSARSRRFYEHVGFVLDEGAVKDWRSLAVVRYRRTTAN
jgi:GNAT superfamily N-acetyltransferase